jgi:hypothetical protein
MSADNVESLGAPKVFVRKTHHVYNIDKKKRQTKNHSRQNLDFHRGRKV